ncbi:unnamed protein product [Angiostrongylus costaricensis]|uniref:Spondin domain-containing protein n=1 Tax=Angiostrongylus costaricensis TaxID=334426 RepID=A0A0R3PBJ3_ANGCS|nr:unnamed protein product [Angiostrongylus costaricensis]
MYTYYWKFPAIVIVRFGCVTKFDWLNYSSIPYRPVFSWRQKQPQACRKSLRYEISWKDERIEYLQRTLTELENSMPCSSGDN